MSMSKKIATTECEKQQTETIELVSMDFTPKTNMIVVLFTITTNDSFDNGTLERKTINHSVQQNNKTFNYGFPPNVLSIDEVFHSRKKISRHVDRANVTLFAL